MSTKIVELVTPWHYNSVMNKSGNRNGVPVNLRMPPDYKELVEQQAAKQDTTQIKVIIRALEFAYPSATRAKRNKVHAPRRNGF